MGFENQFMELKILKPRLSLNKAFLKVKPNRPEIELFKKNLISLIDTIDEFESEEFHKNEVSKFLQNTYYSGKHYINTKDRKDLVIHNGASASSTVGVIIEAKKPTNKAEMLRPDNINVKALQELVFYYLKERIINKNTEIKHLIATNIYEWYIFDAQLFEKVFAQNKPLVKKFIDFQEKRSGGNNTDFFYSEIAAPAIAALDQEITFTHFDIRDYEKPLLNNNPKDDNLLIALFKLLSPEHLLKLPFANDSNSLDKAFYTELLHIIGLTEIKEGGKKLIQRKEKAQRNAGSFLESAIVQLDNLDKISRLEKPSQFGDTTDERLFNVALELSITWINRILFLKLLEAQLIKYHKGDKTYAFLNNEKVKGFDDLNTLFFQVLAKKTDERDVDVKQLFTNVPYLNSSLFEPTDIEHTCFTISQLKDGNLPVLSNSVIKDKTGKKRTGELVAVEYILEFLNAYDFSSEGSEEIQEDNKRLINASVLGLIFEKINGYKDGSFFTPGFITMYMCRETIRRAVVQKFNELKGWNCNSIDDVYNKIEDRTEANTIINSLKLCDPAVGSGHFLVSALNEIIAIKSELRVLTDRNNKWLKEYNVVVENDELIVTDEDGKLFEYNPLSKESQRVQETLFHEKHTIIENCLFGVDLNPNSVKICRLRLWIELLKNAYYKNNTELETLPNIDINIKCGNSLISRYALDTEINSLLKTSNWTINSYRKAVDNYRNAKTKDEKRLMESLILKIKQDFSSEIKRTDPLISKLNKLANDFYNRFSGNFLFEPTEPYSKKEKELEKKKKQEEKIAKKLLVELEKVIEDRKNNVIYDNSFEWRFEFPEVLNDEGDFIGFDMVIGNPPYVQIQTLGTMSKELEKLNYSTFSSMGDLYALFYERANHILKQKGISCFISGSAWMRANYGIGLRKFFNTKTSLLDLIDLSDCNIFDNATVLTNILTFEKSEEKHPIKTIRFTRENQDKLQNLKDVFDKECTIVNEFPDSVWIISNESSIKIRSKIESQGVKLIDWGVKLNYGIKTGYNNAFIIDKRTKDELIAQDSKNAEVIKPLLRGRDVKRFYYDFQDQWLINIHNGIKEKGVKPIIIENYPIIKNHLDAFWDKISNRSDKGDTPYNLRNCAYLDDFEKTKIVYSELTKFLYFSFDRNNKFIDKTAFILTGNDLEFLVCVLNSKLFKYCFAHNFSEIQGNTRVLSKVIFEQIPIKQISNDNQVPFIDLLNQILNIKEQDINSDTTSLETEIDKLVYQLYGLTEEEIKIVEGEKI